MFGAHRPRADPSVKPEWRPILRPHVIVHMSTSIDGRTLPSRWRPEREGATAHYERVHEALGGDAWLVGRVAGQEFAK